MKTILVATDFSPAARNASLFAYEMARALKAKMILFNAFSCPHVAPAFGLKVSRYDIVMQTDKRLLDEADFLDPKKAVIDILCEEGIPDETIINVANEKRVDGIAVGLSGKGRKIFGSNAIALALKSNIPVIIVPEKAIYKDCKTIVFAKDILDNANLEFPSFIGEMMQTFTSKLFVALIDKEGFETSEAIAAPSQDIPGSGERVQLHEADLVLMKSRQYDWFEKRYNKKEIKEIVFHAKIPVIIIPDDSIHEKRNEVKSFLEEKERVL